MQARCTRRRGVEQVERVVEAHADAAAFVLELRSYSRRVTHSSFAVRPRHWVPDLPFRASRLS
ncbi:MAG TPA: hypothetical protein VGH98_19880 [Gemmatimonadaceae bacterium]